MACVEQKNLANTIKGIHKKLRESAKILGADKAWELHLQNSNQLKLYGESMKELSEQHWKNKIKREECRISWTISYCEQYFHQTELSRMREKDLEIIEKIKSEDGEVEVIIMDINQNSEVKLKLLDVGSSGNFLTSTSENKFDVLAIDIAPSDPSVMYCDFLSVPVQKELRIDSSRIESLPANHYDVILFSLLLEYLPSSDQRLKCCEKSYQLLKPEGTLIIITPDSNSQHTNSQLMKNWQYVMSVIGFQRMKLEKLANITAMGFRKSLSKNIPTRWARIYKKPYMEYKLEIPQDRNVIEDVLQNCLEETEKLKVNSEDVKIIMLEELPFGGINEYFE
ncbi:unnamed protein product [Diamesa serratosioi]